MAVYLAELSPSNRRTMMGALEAIARLGMGEHAIDWDVPWNRLRFPHTRALRSAPAEAYAHTGQPDTSRPERRAQGGLEAGAHVGQE